MEFVKAGKPLDVDVARQRYRSSMNSLTQQPSFRAASSYHKFLREMAVAEKESLLFPKDVYVPPWRKTLSEIYGEEHTKRMKAPVESYASRAKRFAEEEAATRSRVDGWSRGLHSRANRANDLST